jgi:hypothetical protein
MIVFNTSIVVGVQIERLEYTKSMALGDEAARGFAARGFAASQA